LLRAEAIEAGYGRVQVLWGAGLAVMQGQTVVLLGANGAGKTTLLKVLLGLMPAWHGTVRFAGGDITAERTDRRVRRGIAYMSEMAVFAGLGRFRAEGLSLLVAEQNVQFLDLADHVFTIEGGRTGFSGTVAELAADDHLRRAYFGLSGEAG
jgi:branched-chain amino acid transport system ATP-binding protein